MEDKTKIAYWTGKTRDAHTLQRLSESKHTKVAEYDKDGNLVKVWGSIKEVATTVFGDYKVVDGSGSTSLYKILRSSGVRGRFKHGSYWFKETELKRQFNCIPKKINFTFIAETQRKARRAKLLKFRKENPITHKLKYSVIYMDNDGNTIDTFDNSQHAGYVLKLTAKTIERYCTGKIKNNVYNLKYGEKKSQPVFIKYPDYTPQKITIPPQPSKAKIRQRTRTRSTVEWYVLNVLYKKFNDVFEASEFLGLEPESIRTLCKHKNNKLGLDLRLAEKIKTNI